MEDQEYRRGIEFSLRQLLQPDTQVVRQATDQLNRVWFKDPRCIPSLNDIMCHCAEWQVRQLAAVLMRRRVIRVWSRLALEIRHQLKAILLQRIIEDDNNLVRHSIARVVSVVAKHDIPAGQWNELLGFLYKCCQSDFVGHREVGMYVLKTLVETVADELRRHISHLVSLLLRSLADQGSLLVRITTAQLIGALAQQLEDESEIELLKPCIPLMIQTLNDCLAKNEEESAATMFDVFDDLIESEVPFLTRFIEPLTETSFRVACATNFDDSLRVRGLLFIQWVAKFKPKVLLRSKLVNQLIEGIFVLLAESDDEEEENNNNNNGNKEEEEEDDETSNKPSKTAAHLLDSMALNLPPESIIPPIMSVVPRFMNDADYKRRRALYVVILVIFEGCAEYLRPSLNDLVQLVLRGMSDPNDKVRDTACLAFQQCATYMQPDISQYHPQAIPALMNLLQDPSSTVRQKACHAIDTFCEMLENDILPYMNELMQKLLFLLSKETTKVQQVIVIAIGAVAHASKKNFQPYFDGVNGLLQQLVVLECHQSGTEELNDDLVELRSLATETVGTIGMAVGLDIFSPYVNAYMERIISGAISLNNERLRECSFAFFSSMAELLKEEFRVYLPQVMKIVLDSAISEEGVQKARIVDDEDNDGLDFGDDEEEEEENGAPSYSISVTTAFLNEKETVCDVIGEICMYSGVHFLPYFKDSIAALEELSEYFHAEVRKAAITSFGKILRTLHSVTKLPNDQISQETGQLITVLIPLYLKAMVEDEERDVVANCALEICESLQAIGMPLVEPFLDELVTMILQIFEKKAYCQAGADDLETEAEESSEQEDSERESALIDAVSDLTGTLAVVAGKPFEMYFSALVKNLKKYTKKNRQPSDRSMAMGCMAEMIRGIGEAVVPHVDQVYPLFLAALHDTVPEVRRNSAFGCGLLCQFATAKSQPHYLTIANGLIPLLQGDDDGAADNACSCLCRMVMALPDALPQDQVFSAIISHLPLKDDYTENENVLHCMISFIQLRNTIVMQKIPELFGIFAKVLGPPEEQLNDRTRSELVQFLRHLSQENRDAFLQVVNGLPEAERSLLLSVLQ